MIDFLAELRWRGQLHQITAEDALVRHLAAPGRVGYAGFDPTADSLTIGNLVPILMLRRWQLAGHVPVALVGGATGLVGDPSGKDAERQLRSREQIEDNIAGQRPIFERLLDFDPKHPAPARLVNNIDWWGGLGFIDVLRDIGKHFSVNEMIRRDSVRTRLEGREHGISYTEFSYMLLQAYDFLHLHRESGCTVQMAGSDQFGNIVSGIDLIRRERRRPDDEAAAEPEAFGVTAPLVTRSDGQKIGKTADGAIWLSADRTSPYRFHQYWMNVADDDADTMLRTFTMLPEEQVNAVMNEHASAPHQRAAQRTLAAAVTDLVHGQAERELAEQAAAALFTGEVAGLPAAQLAAVAAELPTTDLPATALDGEGRPVLELLPETSLASSRREAREFLGSGAISVNGVKVAADASLSREDILDGGLILFRRGRKHWHVCRVVS